MAMQYGGWYDNPATGKNQRWFDGVWTDGAEPSGAHEQYTNQLGALNQSTDTYINDLISQAGGDRDQAIKLLTIAHEQALGTNDVKRAEFLESVSDDLEKEIGAIPYDYKVGVTRTNEDLTRTTEVTQRDRKSALDRLAEDEQVWRVQNARDSQEAKVGQQEDLLKRGILSGTRENATGLAGSEVGKLDTQLTDTLSAYDRYLGRTREDVNRTADDTLFDVNRGATRGLEDLKTNARRAGQGAETSFVTGTEAAKRAFEAQQKKLEEQRKLGKLSNQGFSAYLTQ